MLQSIVAAFDYRRQEAARAWILALKHGGRVDLAQPLGVVLARCAEDRGFAGSILLPVPLHPWRFLERGYDQALALAQGTARAMSRRGRPLRVLSGLKRLRDTAPQGAGGPKTRRSNVSGAFGLRPRQQAAVRGERCILIDDVVTSGATLAECARVLRRAGASEVHALVVASAR